MDQFFEVFFQNAKQNRDRNIYVVVVIYCSKRYSFFATKSIPLNLLQIKKGKPVISAHMFIATWSEHKTNAIEIKSCHVTSIKTYRK